jgi:uncharacterized membrane protein YphA (DoxX/SURF4 family)
MISSEYDLMFSTFGAESIKNELLLIARVLMVLLYVIFGWQKLTDYSGTFASSVKACRCPP